VICGVGDVSAVLPERELSAFIPRMCMIDLEMIRISVKRLVGRKAKIKNGKIRFPKWKKTKWVECDDRDTIYFLKHNEEAIHDE